MERCCASTIGVELPRDKVKAVTLVETAKSLPPPFEMQQAQVLLGCLSLQSRLILPDVRLPPPLEPLVEPGR